MNCESSSMGSNKLSKVWGSSHSKSYNFLSKRSHRLRGSCLWRCWLSKPLSSWMRCADFRKLCIKKSRMFRVRGWCLKRQKTSWNQWSDKFKKISVKKPKLIFQREYPLLATQHLRFPTDWSPYTNHDQKSNPNHLLTSKSCSNFKKSVNCICSSNLKLSRNLNSNLSD